MVISIEDFGKVDIRTGTIINVEDFPEARKPLYRLKIDFGHLGIKNSCAGIVKFYKKEDLLNRQIVAVVNLQPKKVANFVSEVLVLGIVLENKEIVLLNPDKKVQNGLRIA